MISRVVELADDKFIPTVITFDPDPETIFTGKNRKYLTTLKQKKEYLYNYGIKEIIVIPFTKEVSYISKNKFIELFLNNFNLDTLVCGEDFRFGHRGEGSSDYLIKTNTKNFKVEVLEHVLYNHEKISSTLISNLIKEGNIKLAERLLNHDYIIEATILNKEVITENVIPLQGEFNVSINHEKSILKENLIDHPNKKDVSIIFI